MNTELNSVNSYSLTNQLSNFDHHNAQASALVKPFNKKDLPTPEQTKSIAQIYIEQAKVYCQEYNWRKAILACKNALEMTPDLAEAYQILGDILSHQGKHGEALGIYAKALIINPNLAAVYGKIGALYTDRKEWYKALDYCQQAVILNPDLAEAHRHLAQVWEELGETEKALECFCRAIDLDPEMLGADDYFSFGQELYHKGKLKEASILLIHGIQLNPLAEKELAQLVQILEELEEWQQAVAYYHQLMSLPSLPNGTLHQQPTQTEELYRSVPDKPIRKLLSVAKSSPTKVVAKKTKNNIPVLSKDLAQQLIPQTKSTADKNDVRLPNSKLIPDRIEAFKPQPDSALSWNNLGSVYAQQKQWEKAASCYQEALQIDANFAKGYRNLARVYNNINQQLKSALYWYEAFRIEPNIVKPEQYFCLARKLLQYEQTEKAIACLHRAIELKPDFKRAYQTLEQLHESQAP